MTKELIPEAFWNLDKVAREILSHRVNGLNEALRVFVLDSPGSGNACHEYVVCIPATCPEYLKEAKAFYQATISGQITEKNSEEIDGVGLYKLGDGHSVFGVHVSNDVAFIDSDVSTEPKFYTTQFICFQNGPVKEAGYNGNSQEVLLAILIDRLEGFQSGQYACHDNQMALDHVQSARLWLHKRTMDRVARNVEGTHQK